MAMRVYGAILAGGSGVRMQRNGLPKQFLPLGGKPVILHTYEQFRIHPQIDAAYVAVPQEWLTYAQGLFAAQHKARVIAGGKDRNASLMSIVNAIRAEFGVSRDDIIVSHDAVRPFVTQRILDENIRAAMAFGAADTVSPATDTIVEADADFVTTIPLRSRMYHGQTPQTFNITALDEAYASLTDDEKARLTDACNIFVIKGRPVKVVRGEDFNIKITTPFDLAVAHTLLSGGAL